MNTAKCHICALPWLIQKAPWHVIGLLSNSDDDHMGSDAHYAFRFTDKEGRQRAIAISTGEMAWPSNHLETLAAL